VSADRSPQDQPVKMRLVAEEKSPPDRSFEETILNQLGSAVR
jgi:hypothetical protein